MGRLAANHNNFYVRLQRGHDVTSRRAARIAQWHSDNWPPDLDWPDDIPRPEPSSPEDEPVAHTNGHRNGSAASAPTPADLIATVQAALKRRDEAALAQDWNAAKDAKEAALKAGRTLGPDGTLASREALRLALGKRVRSRNAFYNGYYNVTGKYADGKTRGDKEPTRFMGGRESATAIVLDELIIAGDARVAQRARRRATTAAMLHGSVTGVG